MKRRHFLRLAQTSQWDVRQYYPDETKCGGGNCAISITSIIGANGTYIEYYPSAPISCRHRYSRLLTKNFPRKVIICVRASSFGNGQYAKYSPSPHSVVALQLMPFDEKFGIGSWLGFRKKSHSTAAHSISRTGSTDVSPVREIFVIVHFIHFFSLRQSQNKFRFAHSAKRKRCKKQLMKFFHEIAVSASSACRSAMSTVRRVQSNASLGRRVAYTAV